MTAPDIFVLVAKAIAAAAKGPPGRDDEVWAKLTIDEQAHYTMQARLAIEAYVAAVGDART